jgi:aryl-alcohol dehydrogenase-like predicted oxidoreductase
MRRLVGVARELGVTLFDTAPGYGESEEILGRALSGESRGELVIATKVRPKLAWGPLAGFRLRRSVERSLRRLRIETIDLLQFHSVTSREMDGVLARLLPAAERLRERGLIRCIGLTEAYRGDPGHAAVRRALESGRFDVVMAGVHLLDQSAAQPVFGVCEQKGVGGLAMFVVRRLLRDETTLRSGLERLAAAGHVPGELATSKSPLQAILGRPVPSIPRLAYRYAASVPGVTAVLTGASRPEHLRANAAAVLDPLPESEIRALAEAFGGIPGPVAG